MFEISSASPHPWAMARFAHTLGVFAMPLTMPTASPFIQSPAGDPVRLTPRAREPEPAAYLGALPRQAHAPARSGGHVADTLATLINLLA